MRRKFGLTLLSLTTIIFYAACSNTNLPGTWVPMDAGIGDAFYSVNFVNENVGWINAQSDRNYLPIGEDANVNANTDQNANSNANINKNANSNANKNEEKKKEKDKDDPLKNNQGFEVLQTTDGGNTWKQLPDQFKYKIRSVFFVDEQTGWALTIDRDILKTTDGAKTWTTQRKAGKVNVKVTANRRNPLMEQPEQIERIYFLNASHGWAWGGGRKDDYSEQPGIFLKTIDGGQNWNEIKYPFEQNMNSIFFLDANRAWANTTDGKFYKTTDGALNWTEIQGKLPELNFGAICFLDDNNGWVVGQSGRPAKTSDGGKTWLKMVYLKPEFKMRDLHFFDKDHGWAVGDRGEIIYTSNGGDSWVSVPNAIGADLRDVVFLSRERGFAVGLGGAFLKYEGQ
ncbi:MAG: YCF48-related protein [Acidobacteriota bacterium]